MTTGLAQFQATTRQLWQAWQAKTITSDLIFEMVMQNPTLCTELVQRALPELEVGPLHLVNPQQDVHSALLARAAGLSQAITFKQLAVKDWHTNKINGVLVANPPYGERLVFLMILTEFVLTSW